MLPFLQMLLLRDSHCWYLCLCNPKAQLLFMRLECYVWLKNLLLLGFFKNIKHVTFSTTAYFEAYEMKRFTPHFLKFGLHALCLDFFTFRWGWQQPVAWRFEVPFWFSELSKHGTAGSCPSHFLVHTWIWFSEKLNVVNVQSTF